MELSKSDLFLLNQCAVTAALQAGQIILRKSAESTLHTPRRLSESTGFRQNEEKFDEKPQPLTVNHKVAGDSLASQVVTEVDYLSQECILKILSPTCQQFDLALLTEETTDDLKRLEKDYFWCIDPLDGTLPFIESTAGYAVSIALVSRIGIPHIGVIYDPVKETLYNATKEGGVFRNGQPWQLSPCVDNSNKILTVVTDRSFKQHSFFSKILAEIESSALTMRFSGISTIMYGGAAMNACWVLENHPACYFKFPKPQLSGGSLWDFAASACLFKEMGVVVSDMQSKSLDLNRADSTFMNHRGVLYASNDEIADQIKLIYSKATRNK